MRKCWNGTNNASRHSTGKSFIGFQSKSKISRALFQTVNGQYIKLGDSCETAEVLNFIEQCENILEIRPLPSVELIGTLSTVLKGPALSWWKAEKDKVTDWQSFKKAFLAAFLSDDYLSEVE